ncbi:MAG: hypothetical protein ACREJM_06285 [Candidatus Saccharimonadales bacterium]
MNRLQFSLRSLLVVVTGVAVIAWAAKLVGVIAVIVPLLACLPLLGGLFRRPLEGILLTVFLAIVAGWVGIAVFVVAMGD